MSRWSFPTHNLDIEHRVCGVGWFKELWIAEFCMTVFIMIVGLVGSMSFELLSFGWLFFNVIVIECMHKEMWNLFHDIQKCAPLTHCGNDIPWDSTNFLCTNFYFYFFFAEGEVKSGKEIATCKEFHKCWFQVWRGFYLSRNIVASVWCWTLTSIPPTTDCMQSCMLLRGCHPLYLLMQATIEVIFTCSFLLPCGHFQVLNVKN